MYATVSAVFPILHLLNNTFLKESEDDILLTKNPKSHIKDDLNEHYTEMWLGHEVFIILKSQLFFIRDSKWSMHQKMAFLI